MPWAQSTGWGLSRDLRATPDSSCLGLQELESQIVYQEAAERGTRQEFIILPEMRVYPVTGLDDHWCSEQFVFFTERKTISPWRIYFFCQIFPKFQLFFFLVIASLLSSRETQRSKSLLHLSPKSPSHVLKGWMQLRDCFSSLQI